MPERKTAMKAKQAEREGKAPSTQASEFVREEMHHIRQGKHDARSAKQAIAIGLSKARRSGVELPPPQQGATSRATRLKAERDYERGHGSPPRSRPSTKRSRATLQALQHEGDDSASRSALSRQTKSAASKRSRTERSAAARKAVRTKGPAKLSAAAKRAAHTREVRAGS